MNWFWRFYINNIEKIKLFSPTYLLAYLASIVGSMSWAEPDKNSSTPGPTPPPTPTSPAQPRLTDMKASEIVDRFTREQQQTPSVSESKTGLSALKELLFDDMILFTGASVLVLLVALIGAAIIISKRSK